MSNVGLYDVVIVIYLSPSLSIASLKRCSTDDLHKKMLSKKLNTKIYYSKQTMKGKESNRKKIVIKLWLMFMYGLIPSSSEVMSLI